MCKDSAPLNKVLERENVNETHSTPRNDETIITGSYQQHPFSALVLYTDGSKSDSGRTGSGVNATAENGLVFRCRFRNPDNRSVFRSELLAIREALNFALRSEASDTYVLTDSKSSIQYLKNWSKISEKTGQEIISKIVSLSQKSRVCIQWIPSHVEVFGNEVADLLTKVGSTLPSAASGELFASEISSIHRSKANSTWKVPPAHEWYAGNRNGLSLQSEVLLHLLMSLTVLAPLRGCCGVGGKWTCGTVGETWYHGPGLVFGPGDMKQQQQHQKFRRISTMDDVSERWSTPHWGFLVHDFQDETFPDWWIGFDGPTPWPPRYPDITPLDFFSFGAISRTDSLPHQLLTSKN
ncbi:hypothetical protein AVEN_208341-1 [Araneus ventricosus]|uniref:RNase H type-1 domain-containing protein n=1 Tax=Araneus ventricosus TaxID=182803 RepID=A0A4Y2FCR2_ARAVE|nr:hypothetical protein AVEN_208341-1 [Araneus ventricosus]